MAVPSVALFRMTKPSGYFIKDAPVPNHLERFGYEGWPDLQEEDPLFCSLAASWIEESGEEHETQGD